MSKEIIGTALMALAGFFLMVSIEGKVLDDLIRVAFLLNSIFIFYIGMRTYGKYMTKESLSSNDWLIVVFAILTPFIIVSSLNSLGMTYGGVVAFIWLVFSIVAIKKKDKIVDVIMPKIEEKNLENEMKRIRKKYSAYSVKKKKS